MKGLLYGNFVLNKNWFIASAIIAVVGVAVTMVLHGVLPESGMDGCAFIIGEFVVIAVCNEWPGRNLESNLKSRFADYALAGGLSKAQFVMAEMLKNLISSGIAFLMCVVMQLVLCVADRSFFSWDNIKMLLALTLFTGTVEWTCMPAVVELKSAEKAGLLVGIILGFGMVFPLFIAFRTLFGVDTDEEFFSKMLEFINRPLFLVLFAVVCAVVYALFYFWLLNRVKKGDVC